MKIEAYDPAKHGPRPHVGRKGIPWTEIITAAIATGGPVVAEIDPSTNTKHFAAAYSIAKRHDIKVALSRLDPTHLYLEVVRND